MNKTEIILRRLYSRIVELETRINNGKARKNRSMRYCLRHLMYTRDRFRSIVISAQNET